MCTQTYLTSSLGFKFVKVFNHLFSMVGLDQLLLNLLPSNLITNKLVKKAPMINMFNDKKRL